MKIQMVRIVRFTVLIAFLGLSVATGPTLARQRHIDHVLDQQTTGDNDSKRCSQQPCSPDGKWQATRLSMQIGPVPKGYHLENVTLTHSNNDPFPQFCSNPPPLVIQASYSTAAPMCWSAAVTWVLQGDVIPNTTRTANSRPPKH